MAHHSWGAEYQGINDIKELLKKIKSNPQITINDCFAENDRVAVRFQAAFSLDSGKSKVIRNEIAILRFEGDKMAEWWGAYDRLIEQEQRENA